MSTRKRPTKQNAAQEDVPVKATKAQVTQRVNQVYKLLILGKTRAYILQYAADTWDSSERMADEYISRASAMIEEQANRDRETHMKLATTRLELVFNEAYEIGEYKDALGAQHQLNKIMGLYAPTKQDVNVSGSLSWADMINQSRGSNDSDDPKP